MTIKRLQFFAIGFLFFTLSGAAIELPGSPFDRDTGEVLDDVQEEAVVAPETPAPVSTPLNPKWRAPNFDGQVKALGWTMEAFMPPVGMEERVQFWKDIYTKYTSEQGLLHDSLYVSLVYESLDFSDISARLDLNDRGREKARRNRVKEKKKEIADRLLRLQKLKSPEGLLGEDRRYWDMFAKIEDKNKFIEAAKKGRLRFQLGQRNQFISGVFQSGRYLRQMEDIFRDQGLPIELTRLPFVESSFNLRARSRVGASGIWQFMRYTARSYMRMDASADERNDPLRATVAATKKLRENYTMLKYWPLAVTAYNHGPSGVMRMTKKYKTNDIVALTDQRRGRFGFASASFYASFLAALEVEKNADKYFGVLETMPELRGAEIQVSKPLKKDDILKYFNGDLELAQQLNPHITSAVWTGKVSLSKKHYLRVPILQEVQARSEL